MFQRGSRVGENISWELPFVTKRGSQISYFPNAMRSRIQTGFKLLCNHFNRGPRLVARVRWSANWTVKLFLAPCVCLSISAICLSRAPEIFAPINGMLRSSSMMSSRYPFCALSAANGASCPKSYRSYSLRRGDYLGGRLFSGRARGNWRVLRRLKNALRLRLYLHHGLFTMLNGGQDECK